ncbi:hypothetical protein I548_3160 [Mycobacterium intracellulare]|nr:hypothetical protein I548_3160 [Mycobacterium intracellulare]
MLIGLGVLAFVAAVVVAATFFTTTGHGAGSARAPRSRLRTRPRSNPAWSR